MDELKILGSKIQERRRKAGYTQEDFAAKLNISVVHLSRIENGKALASWQVLDNACGYLGCSLSDMFHEANLDYLSFETKELYSVYRRIKPANRPVAMEILESLAKIK